MPPSRLSVPRSLSLLVPWSLGLSVFFLIACEKLSQEIYLETPDWTAATHSAAPDYPTVFPQDKVQRLDIEITASDWTTLQDDLNNMPKGGPGQDLDGSFYPIWIPCDLFYNGKQWYKAGIRAKGNSSLRTAVQSGIKKLSFKLDLDQFEDTYPAIRDQRFHGFKQLNLNNNFEDKSLMREKVAGDLFREFGVPAAHATFCELYVDTGGGPVYFGLYTLVEEVDDTVIGDQFADPAGNLYKPEGNGASFASGSWDTSDLYPKTNEEAGDYSDARALYDALHSSLRTSDPAAWRTLMESVLDMDQYLKWLAANAVMQNWDTYGRMTHNYYLYNDPSKSKFIWIPWDNNEALQDGKQGGAINMNLSGITSKWPLINFIAGDEEFYSRYKVYAKEFAASVFEPGKMSVTYDYWSGLIRDAASREKSGYTFLRNGISDFTSALTQLKQQAVNRFALAEKL